MTSADIINRFYDGESIDSIAEAALDNNGWSFSTDENIARIEATIRGYIIGLRSAIGGAEDADP